MGAEPAPGLACHSYRDLPVRLSSAQQRPALGVTPSVLVRRVLAIAIVAPHDVVIRIEGVVAFDPVADLEIGRRLVAAVDEVMRVTVPRRVARAGAGRERLLTRVGDEHHLT